jgi:hypothetical protein
MKQKYVYYNEKRRRINEKKRKKEIETCFILNKKKRK